MKLYFTINSPHYWAQLEKNDVADSGVADNLGQIPSGDDYEEVIAVAPGEQVITKNVHIPATSKAKITSAIPYVIEDSIVDGIDDMHFALLDINRNNDVQLAYVEKKILEDWLTLIKDAGIYVNRIIPDYLLLTLPEKGHAIVIGQTDSDRVLIRTDICLGATTDINALIAFIQELDDSVAVYVGNDKIRDLLKENNVSNIIITNTGNNLKEFLQIGEAYRGTDLLQGIYERSNGVKNLLKYIPALVIIIFALLLGLAADVYEYVWLSSKNDKLDSEITRVYQEIFPNKELEDYKSYRQVKSEITELRQKYDTNIFLPLLTVSGEVLKSADVNVQELQFKESNLIIMGTFRDFTHLDKTKQAFSNYNNLDVNVMRSSAVGERVQARFEISFK